MSSSERVTLAVLAYSLAAVTAGGREGPVLCPFRRIVGRPCPACGLTRSIGHFSRGRWRRSFRSHPLGPLVLGASVLAGVRVLARAAQ